LATRPSTAASGSISLSSSSTSIPKPTSTPSDLPRLRSNPLSSRHHPTGSLATSTRSHCSENDSI
jgi:hypothetical protein